MQEQIEVVKGEKDMGGTMRLGAYRANLKPDSVVAQAYQQLDISERHRHRYEVNNKYREQLEQKGLIISGTSPDGNLVEFVELAKSEHPFYVSTQAHPEFKSRPTQAHPLFKALITAGLNKQNQN
jgi:CTP synthase